MSKEDFKDRINAENRVGKDFHAARALSRPDLKDLTGETRRESVKIASFRNQGAHLNEQEVMRTTLLGMLDRIEGVRTPEQQKLLERLMSQCESAASVWTDSFPLKQASSKDELIHSAQKWIESLPASVLQGFVELCPDSAGLVVVPGGITAPELLKTIDLNKTLPNQEDGKVCWTAGWNGVIKDKCGFGITDLIEDLDFDPGIYYFDPEAPADQQKIRTNKQMVAEYKRRFEEKGLKIMPQHGYIPAAASRLADRKVFDRQYWTAFEILKLAAVLPGAGWVSAHVDLAGCSPDFSYNDLRCRPWFEGGDVNN